jgi:putative spermidine/putrescine transport system ATP-binding protein
MSQNNLKVKALSKKFGNVVALNNFSLEVAKGELVTLLGPSGCGKTTALRIVAGLERQDSGTIFLDSRDLTLIPAHQRNMGMVFQAYSLFPNLTVAENVAFGLQMRKVDRTARVKRAHELLDLVGLDSQSARFPHQLSGGQQQRVALARALAFEPEILLLDEPLSALDAQVRSNLREEIRRLQLSLGTTTLFVTHDQEEAMSISDRVGVMNEGKLEQIDTPDELYNHPKSVFVANFVGLMNQVSGTKTGKSVSVFGKNLKVKNEVVTDGRVSVFIRPEFVELECAESDADAKVISRLFLGSVSQVICQLNDGTIIHSLLASRMSGEFAPGIQVKIRVNEEEVLVSHG